MSLSNNEELNDQPKKYFFMCYLNNIKIRCVEIDELAWLMGPNSQLSGKEKLQRSGQVTTVSGDHGGPIEGSSGTPRKSEHYGIEGLKESPELGPHHTEV